MNTNNYPAITSRAQTDRQTTLSDNTTPSTLLQSFAPTDGQTDYTYL